MRPILLALALIATPALAQEAPFAEPFPGDPAQIAAFRASVCPADMPAAERPYCEQTTLWPLNDLQKRWAYAGLRADIRQFIRDCIARNTAKGVTDWQNVEVEWAQWTRDNSISADARLRDPAVPRPRITSTCTLTTRTSGTLGNSTTTSTVNCY